MPSKSSRKLAGVAIARSTHRRAGASRAPSAISRGPSGAIINLLLGSGWGPRDLGSALNQIVGLGPVNHLALHVKVISASDASWGSIAKCPAIGYYPDLARLGMPCAVRDASTNRWYVALGSISSSGVVSVTAIGRSANGSMLAPFAVGLGDEVVMSFVYAQ